MIIEGRPTVDLKVSFQLNEAEARAFDALVGYGADNFIKAFYEGLGKAYMQEHEAGLRSLFKSVRESLPGILGKLDNARVAFNG